MTKLHTHPIITPTNTGRLETINFYLVKKGENLILIDAGEDTEECWDELNNQLIKLQLKIENIDAILLTHNHSDHTGLVNRIRQTHHIPVYAHEKSIIRLKRDGEFLRRRVQFFEKTFKEMGAGAEVENEIIRLENAIRKNADQKIIGEISTLKEGDHLFGLDVYEIPGHAPDHVMFRHEASKTMFVGDQILKNSPTNALVECDQFGKRIKSLVLYENSLQNMKSFVTDITYPGHGQMIENTEKVINEKLYRIKKKAERIKKLLSEAKTPSQLAKEMYGKRYETIFPLIMSEVVGHLDRLEHRGEVKSEKINEILYFLLENETKWKGEM